MLRIGHRGAAGHAPENTLASFHKAIALGCAGFEFDVQLSKDGEPVIIHDETLERTTNGKGLVCDFTFAELQTFDAGNGENIPHLREVLALANDRVHLYIEPKAVGAIDAILAATKGKISHAHFTLLAFDHTELLRAKTINANVQTCALFECIPARLAEIGLDAKANAIGPYIGCINQALVDDAHARGLKVFTWTANSEADILKAKNLGVDGIISDFPEKI